MKKRWASQQLAGRLIQGNRFGWDGDCVRPINDRTLFGVHVFLNEHVGGMIPLFDEALGVAIDAEVFVVAVVLVLVTVYFLDLRN